eukprot:3543032-Rhodomonas_salina.4
MVASGYLDVGPGMPLRCSYAMSGTDLAYAATSRSTTGGVERARRPWYAPLAAYARATRCPVLT